MSATVIPAGLGTYVHRFRSATSPGRIPLLLLHRTGGNEDDLIPLAQRVSTGSAILSIRGNVLEDERPRFFRRVGKGKFDIEDLRQRTAELDRFLGAACQHYGIAPPFAIGHSNGANIAWSLMFAGTSNLAGAVLMRPMLAYLPSQIADLTGFPVLVLSGRRDAVVTPDRADELPVACSSAGANVTHVSVDATHDPVEADIAAMIEWFGTQSGRHQGSILHEGP